MSTLTSRKTQTGYLFEDENNHGFLQKTCWYSRAQSGNFGDLITADQVPGADEEAISHLH